MRIAIDFQGAQTGSRFRGIGHYSTELIKALIGSCPDDEFYLILNGAFTESIEPIRAEFEDLLPQENIRVWYAPQPVEHFGDSPGNLREIAEAIREFYFRALEPDLVLLTSIFEGLGDGAIVSVKKFVTDVPVAAIFYDFTPLYMPDEQFRSNPVYRRWYRERIEALRSSDLLLAISESSRREAIELLGRDSDTVVNVFGGRDESFTTRKYASDERIAILRRFDITKPFILYVGGIEPSKNLKRLVQALFYLPQQFKQEFELVCVGKREVGEDEQIQAFALDADSSEMIRTVGFVSNSELIDLYNLCELFVFPSLREGFGLPALQAMSCGAATIVADRTSLPEVVDNPAALFDPSMPEKIASKMVEVLSDPGLRQALVKNGLKRAANLTWNATALKAAHRIHEQFAPRRSLNHSRRTVLTHTGLFRPNRKRILVQKLDHHGDFLLGVPAMAKLRARYPDAEIHAFVGSWNQLAADASGLFDEIHSLDFFKSQSSLRPMLDDNEFRNLVQRLPYFDYALDLRRQSDTRFILARLNARYYFGYRTGDDRVDCLLTNPLEIHPDTGGERSYFDETHTSEQMLRIVDVLPFNANDYLKLPDLGERLPVRRGSVAIFPRVGNDSRQWDSQYFSTLIGKLAANSEVTEINVFCGRDSDLDCIAYELDEKIRVHAGLPFSDLFTTLSSNSVCVGNNSFGVHLAGYAGCRTIGIYSGHELPQQWGPPFGVSLAITVDAPCAPCHLPDRASCPYDLFCLNDISIDSVEAAVCNAIAGTPISEDYSRIRISNPASAIKPLLDAVNRSKFLGRIDGVTSDQRVAVAAAISVNFPERSSAGRCIYLDVSVLLDRNMGGRSIQTFKAIEETLGQLREAALGTVLPIASGPHDHEFYIVDLARIEESLYSGPRHQRIVRPMASDVYVGLHTYGSRNPAQWQLLVTWRQMGVVTVFGAPDELDAGVLNADLTTIDDADWPASYLFTIGHFDGILAPREHCGALRQWLREFGPARHRELICSSSLLALIGELVSGAPGHLRRSNSRLELESERQMSEGSVQ